MGTESAPRPNRESHRQIVLIEDNDADARVIQEALADWHHLCDVVRFRDGIDALAVLLDAERAVPDIILLDLNMPKSDGLDVLSRIRNTPRLSQVPVGILTGSFAPNDRHRASLAGASRYVEKRSSYDQFVGSVRAAVDEMLSGL